MMPIIIDNETGREVDDGYQPQAKSQTSRREGFAPGETGDGLNAFHLLLFTLLLAVVLAAVPFLLGMAQ